MRNDYKFRIRVFLLDIFQRSFIFHHIAISHKTQIFSFSAFYQATPIENFFLLKPNDNIVFRMSLSWIIGLKSILSNVKNGVIFNEVFRSFFVVLFAYLVGEFGGV